MRTTQSTIAWLESGHDPKAMAKFKEQPKLCSCFMCANRRGADGATLQERKFLAEPTD